MIDNRMATVRRRTKDVWYSWYPADYAAKTAHLTAVQDGIYRRLLDHYYLMHGSMVANATTLLRVCRAFDAAEQAAVRDMLAEFFTEQDGYYRHERADAELEKRAALREKRAQAGSKGGKQKVANATNLLGKLPANCQTQSQSQTKKEELDSPLTSSQPEIQNLVDSLLVRAEPEPHPRPASKAISSKVQRGTRWPADAVVPDDWVTEAAGRRKAHGKPAIDLVLEAEKFRNYWSAKSGASATKIDWRATWRNWALNSNGVCANGRGQFGRAGQLTDHPLGIFGQLGDELREREISGSGWPEDHGGHPH